MKTKVSILALSWSVLFCNCSNDAISDSNQDEVIEVPDFQLIGEDEGSIYWYRYDSDSDEGTTRNITQQDNIDRFYISLRQVGDILSFFTISEGNFSLTQKDLGSDATLGVEDFVTITADRSYIWGTTTEDQIIMANYSPPGSGELFLRTVEIGDGTFTDSPLASNVRNTSQPLYFGQRLFVSYLDNNDQYNLKVFDTRTFNILKTWELGNQFPAFLIDSNGDFVLIRGEADNFTSEVYDLDSMNLIETDSFVLSQFLGAGPFDAYLTDGRLYYMHSLVQPSPVALAPAYLDIISGEANIADMIAIRESVRDRLEEDSQLTAYGFDIQSRTFFVGYAQSSSPASSRGGVLIIGENGDLIDLIELPFIPTYFIKS